jgi:hypothetical protein
MPIGAEQACAERVVGVPQLHVGGVGGITDVQRIEHQQPAIVAVDQPLGQPFPAVVAHPLKVGQGQAGGLPLAKGQLGWADFNPVVVIRGAIAQPVGAGGVDLAAVAVKVVHGELPVWPMLALAHACLGQCARLVHGRRPLS